MKQGEIWYANLNPVEGRKQAGFRPVLIISGNLANTYAPVVVCCPLTTKLKHYKGNPVLEPTTTNGLKTTSEVMVIQIKSMAKSRLKMRIGKVPDEVVKTIKQTLQDLLYY